MTEYKPIFQSPIAVTAAPAGVGEDLVLTDVSGVRVILIRGEGLETLAPDASKLPSNPGEVIDTGQGLLARLTPAELYLFGKGRAAKLPSPAELGDRLVEAGAPAHVTDLTHGTAALELTGQAAAEVLGKQHPEN